MAWIYRMSRNDRYPDPADEVRGLAAISGRGEQAFLLLSNRPHPALSGRNVRRGDPIYLCISDPNARDRGLLVHARGRLGALHHGSTPTVVEAIYGDLDDRYFREVVDLKMCEPCPIESRVFGFSEEDEARLLAGQAHAVEFQAAGVPETVEDDVTRESGHLLEQVYDGLTEEEIDEVEAIILSRSRDRLGATN
jgi:hypothetical protein